MKNCTHWAQNWRHYSELLIVRDINAIQYYIGLCEKNNLSKRDLHTIIKNHEYERLPKETKTKLINQEQLTVSDLIPNPIIIKTASLKEELSEYALKQNILNILDGFFITNRQWFCICW